MNLPYEWNNRKNFRVVYDRVLTLPNDNGRSKEYTWKKTIRIKRSMQFMSAASSTTTQGIEDWNMMVYMITSSITDAITDGIRVMSFVQRTTYQDA